MFGPQNPQQRLLSACVRSYVVQRGDTLSQIGRRVGVPWRRLAAVNRLHNPHVIYPGQLVVVP